jgi:predicted transport protein
MIIFHNNKKYSEHKYKLENELEKDLVGNSKLFFGDDTIYIDAKKKIEAKALGGTIPDGFLFDLSDKENPEFYIVEVELSNHHFYNHIFPQITKFFAFYKNNKSQAELIEKIYSIISNEIDIKDEFKKYLGGEKEIYKFLKDVIESSQNILLILDGDKKEIPEIIETYSDTWGKMVKLLLLKKFTNNRDFIYTLHPNFEDIEYTFGAAVEVDQPDSGDIKYSEEFHLDGVIGDIKEAYFNIKEELSRINNNIIFNPKKYYISIIYKKNIAYFQFSKKKIRLVIMLQEEEVKKKIKEHLVKHLSEGVQKFWNGPSCEIIINNKENISEIIDLFRGLIK